MINVRRKKLKLKLLGDKWGVTFHEGCIPRCEEAIAGTFLEGLNVISLKKDAMVYRTLIHEIYEILSRYHIPTERWSHDDVESMSVALYQVMRDNPKIFQKIINGESLW